MLILADYLRAERVTHFLSTPAVASSMDPSGLPDLRMLNVGGESPSPDLIERWSPYVGVVNSYGPTEASVTAVYERTAGPGRSGRRSAGPSTASPPLCWMHVCSRAQLEQPANCM